MIGPARPTGARIWMRDSVRRRYASMGVGCGDARRVRLRRAGRGVRAPPSERRLQCALAPSPTGSGSALPSSSPAIGRDVLGQIGNWTATGLASSAAPSSRRRRRDADLWTRCEPPSASWDADPAARKWPTSPAGRTTASRPWRCPAPDRQRRRRAACDHRRGDRARRDHDRTPPSWDRRPLIRGRPASVRPPGLPPAGGCVDVVGVGRGAGSVGSTSAGWRWTRTARGRGTGCNGGGGSWTLDGAFIATSAP